MAVPVSQMYRVASYVLTEAKGVKRYRCLMLEPLFHCNLAAGCGKISIPTMSSINV
jgi:hypothetical protein